MHAEPSPAPPPDALTDAQRALLAAARQAAQNAYAPYSRFRVGAAVLAHGRTYAGVNVENSSANLGICAERTALAHAVTHGATDIEGLAVCCLDAEADAHGAIPEHLALPCGGCRQWLAELAPRAWIVTNAGPDGQGRVYALDDLLPRPFSLPRP